VLQIVVDALSACAAWLDRRSGWLPWPLWFGLIFFLPGLAALRCTLWFLRGFVWPVRCRYYRTQQQRSEKSCRVWVKGEWSYCRHHRRPFAYADHTVDPRVPRWQEVHRGQRRDKADLRGAGFLTRFSERETLLFYRGYAKRPRDVRLGWADFSADLERRLARAQEALSPGALKRVFRTPSSAAALSGVSARAPRAMLASRLFLLSLSTGLGAIVMSIVATGSQRAFAEYLAFSSFVFGWNYLRNGLLGDADGWIGATATQSLKLVGVFLLLTAIGGGVLGIKSAALRALDTAVLETARPRKESARDVVPRRIVARLSKPIASLYPSRSGASRLVVRGRFLPSSAPVADACRGRVQVLIRSRGRVFARGASRLRLRADGCAYRIRVTLPLGPFRIDVPSTVRVRFFGNPLVLPGTTRSGPR
jgi:hypothetical protein